MAEDKLDLGEHWEEFIATQVASGQYGSASEVLREALRRMAADAGKLEALRAHIDEGLRQADAGEYVADFSMEGLISEALARAKQRA